MICPYCHNENKYDNVTCDFCMRELPMNEERKKEIDRQNKIKKKNQYQKATDKIIGMVIGIIVIVAVVLIGIFVIRK